MRTRLAVVILLLAGAPALAHRLDEYLQNTLISVDRNHVEVQIALTPGVAVLPALMAVIDADGDGEVSESEQRAYATRVLGDISLTLDGQRLAPQLRSLLFPNLVELREGRGEIRMNFTSVIPAARGRRKLVFENKHQPDNAAYQVNCLVPQDSAIRILAQQRDYVQSRYELEYEQTETGSQSPGVVSWTGRLVWLGLAVLVLSAPVVFRPR